MHCISPKIYFVLANSADPDDLPHYNCLPKYLFRVKKGYTKLLLKLWILKLKVYFLGNVL